MNKKGFTLVELLAVIVILTLLAIVTTTSISKIVSNSKKDLSKTQMDAIKSAAKIWGAENLKKLPDAGECAYITLGDLKRYGIIDNSINNPSNNKPISDDLKIKITNTFSEYGKEIINYEINSSDVDSCKWGLETPCQYKTDGINEMVVCGTEEFYVITKTEESITMLAKYNIKLTSEPLQDPTDKDFPSTNPIAFASTSYYKLNQEEMIYVYNSRSYLFSYVTAYKNTLKQLDINVLEARLISYDDMVAQGCEYKDSIEGPYFTIIKGIIICPNKSAWIHSTSYWTGFAKDMDVFAVNLKGREQIDGSTVDIQEECVDGDCDSSTGPVFGVRPVITISINDVS